MFYGMLQTDNDMFIKYLSAPEVRVFIAATRVLDKHAKRVPQRYIDAAWLLGLLETELDCDPPHVIPTPTQKYLDLQEKYYPKQKSVIEDYPCTFCGWIDGEHDGGCPYAPQD